MRGFPPERRITHSCRMASLLVPTLKLTSRKYMGRSFVEPSFDCSGVITSIGTGACCEKRRFLAASRPASESCGREGSREAVRRSIGREQTRGERPGATCGAHAPPARQTQTPCGNRRQPSRHRQPPWPQSIRRQQCWPGRRRSRGRSPAEHHAPPHTINRRRPAPRTGRGATRRSGRHPFRRRWEQGTRGTQRDRAPRPRPRDVTVLHPVSARRVAAFKRIRALWPVPCSARPCWHPGTLSIILSINTRAATHALPGRRTIIGTFTDTCHIRRSRSWSPSPLPSLAFR